MNQKIGASDDSMTSFQSPQIIQKQFSYHQKSISYLNRASIKQNQDQGKGNLSVRNFLCHKQNYKMIKITQILFEDRIITITDEFYPGDAKDSNLNEKKLKGDKLKDKILTSDLNLLEESFMVTQRQTIKQNKSLLQKLYRRILRMYVCWLDCFQNLTAEQDVMKSIIKRCKKITLQFLDEMKNAPIVIDSFKRFLSCNSKNFHNISKQNSRQNYLKGTKKLVKYFQGQEKGPQQQIVIPKDQQKQSIIVQDQNNEIFQNTIFQQQLKTQVEKQAQGIERQKTTFSLSQKI